MILGLLLGTMAKKKDSRSKNRPQTMDRRALDEVMASLGALLEEQEFESIEEANSYLNEKFLDDGHWNIEDDSVVEFLSVVSKKFPD